MASRWRLLAVLVLLAVVVCSAANDDHASREQLYVELRALAERHRTPFEVPTAVLVGHHNDGASALLEALVGLRIAHVGASMATRRPLRVEMAYDAGHAEPALFHGLFCIGTKGYRMFQKSSWKRWHS